jgi:dolichol kinase
MGLHRAETARKLVHIAAGAPALLLRWLSWPEAALMALAALLFNGLVLPRVGGRALWRGERGRPYDPGILLYPAAVLALVLVFRGRLALAAAVWGVMACGDGMATLVGRATGGPPLPWNGDKTWSGLAAFVVCGAGAAAVLFAWTSHLPLSAAASARVLGGSVALALVCGLVESLPTGIDDNLTVPLAGALMIAALARLLG